MLTNRHYRLAVSSQVYILAPQVLGSRLAISCDLHA